MNKFTKIYLDNLALDRGYKLNYISEYDNELGLFLFSYLTILSLDPNFTYVYKYIEELVINNTYTLIKHEREKQINIQPSEN